MLSFICRWGMGQGQLGLQQAPQHLPPTHMAPMCRLHMVVLLSCVSPTTATCRSLTARLSSKPLSRFLIFWRKWVVLIQVTCSSAAMLSRQLLQQHLQPKPPQSDPALPPPETLTQVYAALRPLPGPLVPLLHCHQPPCKGLTQMHKLAHASLERMPTVAV